MKAKKYLYKINGKYVYPNGRHKKYYTPVEPGPLFSSGKRKKMVLIRGKYIHIDKLEFYGPPTAPLLLPAPAKILLLPRWPKGKHRKEVMVHTCRYCLVTYKTKKQIRRKRSYCSYGCGEKYRLYEKRFLPMWWWRFYSENQIYLWVHSYPRKYKKMILKTGPKNFINFFFKIFKLCRKIRTYFKYHKFYLEKTKVCEHWTFYITKNSDVRISNNRRNFCNDKCKKTHEANQAEALRQRNLAAWGTEHRPDAETRRIINNRKHVEWDTKRKKDDPAYKLIRRMRLRTKKVLGASYRRSTHMTDVYTRLGVKNGKELKQHLESLWKPGMSWDNYGVLDGWVIDHVIPLKYYKDNFDLANDLEIQKKAFGKHNLQPLWWMENAKKSAKMNYEFE
tara:strand:- start:262 stop:1437 length:1176 start_codon:yes stop_codon:yes gene_type:complete